MRVHRRIGRLSTGRRCTSGFTLIELLVVVGIIGVIAAILLPAIQSAMESARRTKCQSNLRQLGTAIIMFEQTCEHLPSATYGDPYANFPTGVPLGGIAGSPFTKLLPFLEQSNVSDLYNWDEEWFAPRNQPAVNTEIGIFRCPSSPATARRSGLAKEPNRNDAPDGTAATTDYTAVYSFGYPMAVSNTPPLYDVWAVGALSPATEEAQGFFNLKYRLPRRRDTSDAESTTFTFIERAAPTQRYVGRRMIDPSPMAARSWAPWAGRGCTWVLSYESGGETWAYTGIGPCNVNCNNSQGVYVFHPTGANALFLDGSVRFLSEDLDGLLLHAFVSRSRGEQVRALE